MEKLKVVIINGHPSNESFCRKLTDEYILSVRKEKFEVYDLNLSDLKFDPILRFGHAETIELEPDLVWAQKLISEANHLVFIYPNWWGTMPALLKAFIDRIFLPGFAFQYQSGKKSPKKLLEGKTSHLVITMDTPPWYYKYIQGNPGVKVFSNLVLKFSGIKVTSSLLLGPIRNSTIEKRNTWIKDVQSLAKNL